MSQVKAKENSNGKSELFHLTLKMVGTKYKAKWWILHPFLFQGFQFFFSERTNASIFQQLFVLDDLNQVQI